VDPPRRFFGARGMRQLPLRKVRLRDEEATNFCQPPAPSRHHRPLGGKKFWEDGALGVTWSLPSRYSFQDEQKSDTLFATVEAMSINSSARRTEPRAYSRCTAADAGSFPQLSVGRWQLRILFHRACRAVFFRTRDHDRAEQPASSFATRQQRGPRCNDPLPRQQN